MTDSSVRTSIQYLPIGDVSKTVSPKVKIKSGDYLHEGKYPIIDQGSSFIGGYTNEEGAFTEDEYIVFGDHTCVVKFIDFPFVQGADGVKVIAANKEIVLPKYLYYCMDNIKMEADYSRHWSKMRSTTIPVPSLDIQKEIVRKLDCFSSIILKLEEELTLRKMQFQFYIDKMFGTSNSSQELLAKETGTQIHTLNEIGSFTRGKRFVKADSVEQGTPCIHYGELYTFYGTAATKAKSYLSPDLAAKLRFAQYGDVVIVAAGENNVDIGVGVAWLGEEKVAVHDACYTYSHGQDPKYISYYLRSRYYHQQIKKYVAEGKICSISSDGIGKARLPVPPIEKQHEIVKQLDLFDSLCNSDTVGIPAEIAERKKQYQYYRETLLSFMEG